MTEPRVAVFGGSFNPPHIAHRMLMAAALESNAVDCVWMIPTFRHAFGKSLAPYEDRVAMCERVAAAFAGTVIVSWLEAELGGESRTLPLLERLGELLPGSPLRLLIGADILGEAHKWHRWTEVARRAPPLVFGRAGVATTQPTHFTLPDISSTEIRRRLAAGEDASSLVPARVLRYIASRGLYEAASSS